ncbi:hyaluronidase-5-like [Ambystoma mexicanum]|uniref:hyaluronidase-5-like n=1 Tax=Ambystoma mexicanum TaxID=8296 RepID=UPI0037E987AF
MTLLEAMQVGAGIPGGGSSRRWFCVHLLAALLFLVHPSSSLSAPPLMDKSPFLLIWNAPTEKCGTSHNASLNLRFFQYVTSPKLTATNQNLTLFYEDRLGTYPYIDVVTGQSVNGGIPQRLALAGHLQKAAEDIRMYMPSGQQAGLAVIDWESWRPTWARNWAFKRVYQSQSLAAALLQDQSLTKSRASLVAKRTFEDAAQRLMLETLALGKSLRPATFWGYYLFPQCYNYDYKQNPNNYTGICPDIEKKRNDDLHWLWQESTALYPSIYLETVLRSSPNAALYSRNQIQEAKRVSTIHRQNAPLPIYVFARPVFTNAPTVFLHQDDLVNTIGESAALGVSGIIMWGDLSFSKSVASCRNLDEYLQNTLNPYVINVTLAAKLCSQLLCQGKGVCTRRNWNISDYLHLNPQNFNIKASKHGKFSVIGHPTVEDFQEMAAKFKCSCYAGNDCLQEANMANIRNAPICISDDVCIMTENSTLINSGNTSSSS